MSWLSPELFAAAFTLAAAAVGFLLGTAIGLSLYCLPDPYRFGFEVRHVDE